jgi:hypothetical protein
MEPTVSKKTKEVVEPVVAGPIDDYSEFLQAAADAQLTGLDELEVSSKLFKAISKGLATDYITWGHPSVTVYEHGRRNDVIAEENIGAEAHYAKTLQAKANKR